MRSSYCSYCGKECFPKPGHLYKAYGETQCSYTCYLAEGGKKNRWKRRRKNAIGNCTQGEAAEGVSK